jgi:hypothetical protein
VSGAEPVGDEGGFVAFIAGEDDLDGLAAGFAGEEGFVAAFLVVLDEAVGGAEDGGG